MANKHDKNVGNVSGKFYIDTSCTDCDLCRQTAPATFRRNDDIGMSIAHRQPVTAEEHALAIEAMNDCPTESIGNDGE